MREMLADRVKIDATASTTLKSHWRKHATTADKRMAALEVELAEENAAHAKLVDISAQTKADATKAQAGLRVQRYALAESSRREKW